MVALAGGREPPIWWNVVFLERAATSWWDLLSPRWARHVLAYAWCTSSEAWIVVDPQDSGTAVYAVPDYEFDDLLGGWINVGATILRIRRQALPATHGRALQTCSSIIGRIVGAKSAWRPMALFRSLMALEAEIRHPLNEHQGKSAARRS